MLVEKLTVLSIKGAGGEVPQIKAPVSCTGLDREKWSA